MSVTVRRFSPKAEPPLPTSSSSDSDTPRQYKSPRGSSAEPDDGMTDDTLEGDLLNYEQALDLWEKRYAAQMLAKGWTRAEVDQGWCHLTDGTLKKMVYTRPINKGSGIKRTELEWFTDYG